MGNFIDKNNPTIAFGCINRQGGSAMMIAVFILVVVMMFGSTLMGIFTTSSEAVAQEVLGTRALAAANSAMQARLLQLFPLDDGLGTASLSCPAEPSVDERTYSSFTAEAGLYTCQAKVSCFRYAQINGIDYYRLKSTGECGTGTMEANSKHVVLTSRSLVVEVKGL